MTAPAVVERDDVLEKAKQLRAAGVPLPEIERYIASKRKAAVPSPAAPVDMEAPEPGYGERLATHVLNAAQGIPGMEAVEAAGGMLGSHLPGNQPMTYQESLNALRENTGKIGGKTRAAERMLGSVATLPFLPANPAAAGALLGGADQALSADPIKSKNDLVMRAGKTALGAGAGAVVGKTLDAAVTGARGLAADTPGEVALALKGLIRDADEQAYGTASREAFGRSGPTPSAVTRALAEKDIAPYVKEIRASRKFGGADDATVLREAYKLMSERQGLLTGRIKSNDFKAGTSLEQADLGLAKQQLLSAAETPETLVRPAVTREVPAVSASVEPITTAQSPAPSLREALDAFHSRQGIAARRLRARSEETVAQRHAREALERRSAELEAGALRGSPRTEATTVELSPAHTELVAPEAVEQVDALMPSFRRAVEQHSELMGRRDALRAGVTTARRFLGNGKTPPTKLETKSPEALIEALREMSPEQLAMAEKGILGELGTSASFGMEPTANTVFGLTKGFGVGPYVADAARVAPLLRTTNTKAQQAIEALIKAGLLTARGTTTP